MSLLKKLLTIPSSVLTSSRDMALYGVIDLAGGALLIAWPGAM